MKKICLHILLILSMLSSCDKIEQIKDLVDELDTRVRVLDPSTGDVITGFAADGASVLEIKVVFNSEELPVGVNISSEDEEFGSFSSSQESKGETDISYDLTQEDLERGYALLYLHSEEKLPEALETDSIATINYDVEVLIDGGDIVSRNFDVVVVRPPVIFAHGFGSDKSTYDPMLSYITPKGLYISQSLYVLDYSATSLASYDVNRNVIADAIDDTKAQMLDAGYLFEKATVVGHSMGGVLTRLYLQSSYGVDYRNDILKIITIDSPFTGTQLANFGVALADKYPDSPLKIIYKIGAIIDFQVDSDATLYELNGVNLNKVILPTHILSATFGDTKSIVAMISEKQYVEALLTFLLQNLATNKIYGEDNDLIVPLSSQICGISEGILKNYVTTYSGQWHCSVHATEQAAIDVLEILDTPSTDSKMFSTDGFKPSFLSYDSDNHSSVEMIEVSSDEIKSLANILIKLGVDESGNIIDMGYESEDETIEISNSSVVTEYILGVSSDNSERLYFN